MRHISRSAPKQNRHSFHTIPNQYENINNIPSTLNVHYKSTEHTISHDDDTLVDASVLANECHNVPSNHSAQHKISMNQSIVINCSNIMCSVYRHLPTDIELCYKLPRIQLTAQSLNIEYMYTNDIRCMIQCNVSYIQSITCIQYNGRNGQCTIELNNVPSVATCEITGPKQRIHYTECVVQYSAIGNQLIYSNQLIPELIVFPNCCIYNVVIKQYRNGFNRIQQFCRSNNITFYDTPYSNEINQPYSTNIMNKLSLYSVLHDDDEVIDMNELHRQMNTSKSGKAKQIDRFMNMLNK